MYIGLSRGTRRHSFKDCKDCSDLFAATAATIADLRAALGQKARSHSGVLAVTVRTDRDSGRSGSKGCITPVFCVVCRLPVVRCRCVAGVDY